ncbi:MAG: chemotaxis protein [Xanthomonadales bacterium]|nr:chemotaxis protein [Xanthomonadaceae bacterium]MBN8224406.1 chemotaxis protein [Xanthomonadales bacterium]MCA0196789.1 chemotaxis protein [Pseudomonadota bacterium]
MSAADPAKPVALLARAGAARDRLREALDAAGARVVLEEDPVALDAGALAAAAPQAVLVALEPAVEDALAELEPALEAPGLLVIFDEAELAARRDGWEAQRWIRHLAAKLHGHGQVLPPGCEEEMVVDLQPGRPTTPQQLHAEDPFDAYLNEAAALAGRLPQDRPGDAPAMGLDDALRATAEAAASPQLPAAHEWALAEDGPAGVPARAPEAPGPDIDFSGLELVALEEDRPPLVGVVLVMAGVGGPDAVRKLLGALPAEFGRALLVQLKLDGGRYDNLVKQLARVSKLPVSMAMPGDLVNPATAYVLPEGVGVAVGERGLGFVEGGEPIEALPPAESAAIVLSGADTGRVDAVLALAARGGYVAGQALEGCYDAAAVTLLAAGGVELGTPARLAEQLVARWN